MDRSSFVTSEALRLAAIAAVGFGIVWALQSLGFGMAWILGVAALAGAGTGFIGASQAEVATRAAHVRDERRSRQS